MAESIDPWAALGLPSSFPRRRVQVTESEGRYVVPKWAMFETGAIVLDWDEMGPLMLVNYPMASRFLYVFSVTERQDGSLLFGVEGESLTFRFAGEAAAIGLWDDMAFVAETRAADMDVWVAPRETGPMAGGH